MSWDYFALFAIVALLFWGLGAFAAWRGKRPVVVYTLTCLGLAVFSASLSACGFLWSVLRCGRWGDAFVVFILSSIGRNHHLQSLEVQMDSRFQFRLVLGVCLHQYFRPEIHNKTLMPALQSPWFTPHVIVYMFAYAMLGAATVMAVYLLWFKKKELNGMRWLCAII